MSKDLAIEQLPQPRPDSVSTGFSGLGGVDTSKRQTLRILAGGFSGLVLGFGSAKPISAVETPQVFQGPRVIRHPVGDPDQAAKEYLEQSRNIQLLTLDRVDSNLASYHPEVPRSWSEMHVAVLDKALGQLKGFARDSISQEPIPVVLSYYAEFYPVDPRRLIYVDFRVLNNGGERVTLSDLTGMLVLWNMPLESPIEQSHMKQPIEIRSQWIDDLVGIIGGRLHSPPDELRDVANDRGDPNKRWYEGTPDFTTGRRGTFSLSLDRAINTGIYPLGLISHIAREALYGREEFIKEHERYLPSEVAEKLYGFARDRMGIDYEKFPI